MCKIHSERHESNTLSTTTTMKKQTKKQYEIILTILPCYNKLTHLDQSSLNSNYLPKHKWIGRKCISWSSAGWKYTFDCSKGDGPIFDSDDNSNYLAENSRKLCWEEF